MSAIDVAYEVGKAIITDHNVATATQKLIKTTIIGGGQIVGTTVAGGSVGATASSVAGSIHTAAAKVGQAVMGTPIVTGVTSLFSGITGTTTAATTTTASAAALGSVLPPILIGGAIIVGLCWLFSD